MHVWLGDSACVHGVLLVETSKVMHILKRNMPAYLHTACKPEWPLGLGPPQPASQRVVGQQASCVPAVGLGLLQMFTVTVYFCMYNCNFAHLQHCAQCVAWVMLLNPDRPWTCPECRAQHDMASDAQRHPLGCTIWLYLRAKHQLTASVISGGRSDGWPRSFAAGA